MNTVHIRSIDMNLLVVAAALFRHRNATKAAEDLGLSQSAVSHALGRLRDQLKDPLFVRTSRGLSPTEYARSIQTDLTDIVRRTELLLSRKTHFDPREARSRITLAATDYFEILAMPKLEAILSREAPHLLVSLRPTHGALPKREMEEGLIDFAIAGFYRDLPEGFYQSKLFSDEFLCAVHNRHALARHAKLTVDQYYEARHALITLQGDFQDRARSGGRQRHFVYGSYSFTGMAWVLQNSDLLLTAPALLIKQYQLYFPLKVWPPPIEMSGITVRMIWHAQTHEDPLRIWFRAQLKKVCEAIS